MRQTDDLGQLNDNFIYKVFNHRGKDYPQGLWLLEIRDYKTDQVYGTYIMPLPNRLFEDGTHFYDYLDRYLCGAWLSQGYRNSHVYDWWDPKLKGTSGRWISKGIMEFNPETEVCTASRSPQKTPWRWGWFFPTPRTGTQSKLSGFARSFSHDSYQHLEKRMNPHLYRNLWATWGFQVGLSETELRSLAYAMGMSLDTMRRIYDRSTPEEKTRPISEAIDRILFQHMSGSDETESGNPNRAERIRQAWQKLSPEERKRLLKEWLDGDGQVS